MSAIMEFAFRRHFVILCLLSIFDLTKGCQPIINAGALQGFSGSCTGTLEMDLSSSQIVSINDGSFDLLTDVKILDLSNNLIEVLRPGTFDALTSLTSLGLANNELVVVAPSVFEPVINAKIFTLNAFGPNMQCSSIHGISTALNQLSVDKCLDDNGSIVPFKYNEKPNLPIDFIVENKIACFGSTLQTQSLDLDACLSQCSSDPDCRGFSQNAIQDSCQFFQSLHSKNVDPDASCYLKKALNPFANTWGIENFEISSPGYELQPVLAGQSLFSSFPEAYAACISNNECTGFTHHENSFTLSSGSVFTVSAFPNKNGFKIKDETAKSVFGQKWNDLSYERFMDAFQACYLTTNCIAISYSSGVFTTQKVDPYKVEYISELNLHSSDPGNNNLIDKIDLTGKSVSCSSTYYGPEMCYYITDGALDSYALTNDDNSDTIKFFEIDLGTTYKITSFKVYSRQGCCPERMQGVNFQIIAENGQVLRTVNYDYWNETLTVYEFFSNQMHGRYFRISRETGDYLQAAEVELYGYPTVYNVALNKPASQSSVYDWRRPPSKCNDGSDCSDSTCVCHTAKEINPWWEVDLQGSFNLSSFRLYNRADLGLHTRIKNFKVEFLNAAKSVVHTVSYSEWNVILLLYEKVLTFEVIANYIKVSIVGTQTLNFREFQAFGVRVEEFVQYPLRYSYVIECPHQYHFFGTLDFCKAQVLALGGNAFNYQPSSGTCAWKICGDFVETTSYREDDWEGYYLPSIYGSVKYFERPGYAFDNTVSILEEDSSLDTCKSKCSSYANCIGFDWSNGIRCTLYKTAVGTRLSPEGSLFVKSASHQTFENDMVVTFRATGCPNMNISQSVLSFWRGQPDLGLFDMNTFCAVTLDGSSTQFQKDTCCGVDVQCTPSACIMQPRIVKSPFSDSSLLEVVLPESSLEDHNDLVESLISDKISLVRVEFGRKIEDSEDSYYGNSEPAFSQEDSTKNQYCHPIDITSDIDNQKIVYKDDPCVGVYKIYYLHFHGLELVSPRSVNGAFSYSYSTVWHDDSIRHLTGWIDSRQAWSASSNDRAWDYYQINLGKLKTVRGIVTQGRRDEPQSVTAYTIAYSVDGVDYIDVSEGKVFDGNFDRNSKVYHFFAGVKARFVRITPKGYTVYKSMRAGAIIETEKNTNLQLLGSSLNSVNEKLTLDYDENPRWELFHVEHNKYQLVCNSQYLSSSTDGSSVSMVDDYYANGLQDWYIIPLSPLDSRKYMLKNAYSSLGDKNILAASISGSDVSFSLHVNNSAFWETDVYKWTIDPNAFVNSDATGDLVNLAKKKPVTSTIIQSSSNTAAMLVDDNLDTYFYTLEYGGVRWIEVDLEGNFIIKRFALVNRKELVLTAAVLYFQISFLNSDRSIVKEYSLNDLGSFQYLYDEIISGGVLARYVRIETYGSHFYFSELRVFGNDVAYADVMEGAQGACRIGNENNKGIQSAFFQEDYTTVFDIFQEVSCADICSHNIKCLGYSYAYLESICEIYFTKPDVVKSVAQHKCRYKVFTDKEKIISPEKTTGNLGTYYVSNSILKEGWLDSGSAWTADPASATYTNYAIDLGILKTVTGVVTQGPYSGEEHVTTFNIEHSSDCVFFKNVEGRSSFDGHTNDTIRTRVTNRFRPVVAQCIRITPTTWVGGVAMRIGLITKSGYLQGENVALAKTSVQSTIISESANGNDGSFNSMIETDAEQSPWWSVDLASHVYITGIALHVNPESSHFPSVTDFLIEFRDQYDILVATVSYREFEGVHFVYRKTFDTAVVARHVTISIPFSDKALIFRELEVFEFFKVTSQAYLIYDDDVSLCDNGLLEPTTTTTLLECERHTLSENGGYFNYNAMSGACDPHSSGDRCIESTGSFAGFSAYGVTENDAIETGSERVYCRFEPHCYLNVEVNNLTTFQRKIFFETAFPEPPQIFLSNYHTDMYLNYPYHHVYPTDIDRHGFTLNLASRGSFNYVRCAWFAFVPTRNLQTGLSVANWGLGLGEKKLQQITFDQEFSEMPTVAVHLTLMGSPSTMTELKLSTTVKDITTLGFTIEAETWATTVFDHIQYNWMASVDSRITIGSFQKDCPIGTECGNINGNNTDSKYQKDIVSTSSGLKGATFLIALRSFDFFESTIRYSLAAAEYSTKEVSVVFDTWSNSQTLSYAVDWIAVQTPPRSVPETNINAIGLSELTNLAKGKTVTASTIDPQHQLAYFVDDDLQTSFVSATNGAEWIQVDLADSYAIQSFELYNRQDSTSPETIENFSLFILDHEGNIVDTYTYSDWGNSPLFLYKKTMVGSVVGRFLRIELNENQKLQLGELKVYGSELPFNAGGSTCRIGWNGVVFPPKQCPRSCNSGEETTDGYQCQSCAVQSGCEVSNAECLPQYSLNLKCDLCSNEYMLTENVCTACTEQTNCKTSATDYTACVESSNDLVCNDCNPGSFLNPMGTCLTCVVQEGCLSPELDCLPDSSALLGCSECGPEYELNNGACSGCEEQQLCITSDAESCVQFTRVLVCEICHEGFYPSNIGACEACIDQEGCKVSENLVCLEDSSLLVCSECEPNYYLSLGNCTACTEQSNCKPSATDSTACVTSSMELVCNDCLAGFYLDTSGKCQNCDIPEIATLGNCATVDGCSGTDGQSDIMCANCAEGFYLTSQKCNACQPIPFCKEVTASCDDNSTFLGCNLCDDSHYLTETGECQACTEQADCKPAESNHTTCVESSTELVCNECETGSFPNTLGICLTCIAQEGCLSSEAECLPDSSGLLECSICGPEYDLNNGACAGCSEQPLCNISNADSCVQFTRVLVCEICQEGYFPSSIGACEACTVQEGCRLSANSDCLEDTSELICHECDSNYHLSMGKCSACTEQSNCRPSATDDTACVASSVELVCNDCMIGFYLDSLGQCQSCDIPEIATLRNCASVDDCSGTDGKTDILCTNCTDGFYLDSQTCNACQPIPLCNDTSTTCNGNSTSLNCNRCNDGFYLTDTGSCESCNEIPSDCTAIGFGCAGNSKFRACVSCIDGYFAPDGLCVEQDCENNGKDNSTCAESVTTACIINKNYTQCQVCKENYYLEAETGSCLDKCSDSPDNCDIIVKDCFQGTTVRQCSHCTEGYYVTDDGECKIQDIDDCNQYTKEDLHCEILNTNNGYTQCAINSNKGSCKTCEKGYLLSPEGLCETSCSKLQDSCIRLGADDLCLDQTTTRFCEECSNGKYSKNGRCEQQDCQDKYQDGCAVNDPTSKCVFNANIMRCIEPNSTYWLDDLGVTSLCSKSDNCIREGGKCIQYGQLECLECDFGFDVVDGLCVSSNVGDGSGGLATSAIVAIVVSCIVAVAVVLIVAFLWKKKANRDLEKIEKQGLGGLTPEQFVLNEIQKENERGNTLLSHVLQTDSEYQQAQQTTKVDYWAAGTQQEQSDIVYDLAETDDCLTAHTEREQSDVVYDLAETDDCLKTQTERVYCSADDTDSANAYWANLGYGENDNTSDIAITSQNNEYWGNQESKVDEHLPLIELENVKAELEYLKQKMMETKLENERLKAALENIEA